MLKKLSCFLLTGFSLLFAAESTSLTGTVKTASGTAVSGAKVYLAKDTAKNDLTDNDGKFEIVTTNTARPYNVSIQKSFEIAGHGSFLNFSVNSAVSSGAVTVFSGNGRIVKNIGLHNIEAGSHSIPITGLCNGFYILQINTGEYNANYRLISAGSQLHVSDFNSREGESRSPEKTAKIAAVVDTLIAVKDGYTTVKKTIESYSQTNIAIVMEEESNACEMPELPAASSLPVFSEKLPDPLKFYSGKKLTKKSEWACRRAEILAMAGKYLYGPMPPDSITEITGTFSGTSLKATVKVGSKTKNLSYTLSGSSDILCFVTGSGITPSGCRTFSLGKDDASTIKDLYGYSEVTGTIASAWTANVICKVIEQNPTGGINPDKIMVTGCSGSGKVAMTTGAFVEGIDLTLIVESGGGGAASFRQVEWFRHGGGKFDCLDGGQQKPPQGIDNLEDDGASGPWVSHSAADWVRKSPAKVKNLPFDQHCVLACIAPRAVCHVTNQHGKGEWCHLGGTCEALSAWAAEPVWNALGVPDNFGFLMYTEGSAPMHCSNPASAKNLANEFFKRVFQGDKTAKTDVMAIKDADLQQPVSEWKTMWIDWDMEATLQ